MNLQQDGYNEAADKDDCRDLFTSIKETSISIVFLPQPLFNKMSLFEMETMLRKIPKLLKIDSSAGH